MTLTIKALCGVIISVPIFLVECVFYEFSYEGKPSELLESGVSGCDRKQFHLGVHF